MAACSASTLYYKPLKQRPTTPWDGSASKWGGYIETSKGSGKYDISFEAYNKPGREAVAHFILLRAAERTLIDGYTDFYASGPRLTSRDDESYFPASVVPGYWDTVSIRHCTRNRKTNTEECHYDYEDVWCPPVYIPARFVTNYIHKGTLSMNYRGGGTRYNALDIVNRALTETKQYGKPKLDPRVMQRLQPVKE